MDKVLRKQNYKKSERKTNCSNCGMWLLCSVACACLEILKKLVKSQKNSY